MIEVVTSEEMVRIEKGCDPQALMEQAGQEIAKATMEYIRTHKVPKKVTLLVGPGNNGGDALVAGIYLLSAGIQVQALMVSEKHSPLNKKYSEIFFKKKGKHAVKMEGVVLDGLFGTGLKAKVDGKAAKLIEEANASGLPILAIDIPSGLDGTTGKVHGTAIHATETIAIGFPKIGFFVGDGWNHVGEIKVVDLKFGKTEVHPVALLSTKLKLPKITRTRHKYQAGYVVGFAGSKEMPGAAKLAGFAALKSGAGIVRIFSKEPIGDAPMELICNIWSEKAWNEALEKAGSVFVGPGLGSAPKLNTIDVPVVFDADALVKGAVFPRGAVLTPHNGEAMRLMGVKEDALMQAAQKFCDQGQVVMVLKGAPTFIFSPGLEPIVITRGDPGMASAGVGDVLTGMIASLLAQGKGPLDAAVLGTTLHGIAGEIAARDKTSYCMTAGDLIAALPEAFKSFM